MNKEIFKPIKGFYPYYISNYGQVLNIKTNKIRKQQNHYKGYKIITLRNEKGERKTLKVHRLVALTFIENPNNYTQVNHIDGNKENNCVDNLEWCNNQINQKHAFAHNLQSNKGSKNPRSILTENQVKELKEKGKYDTYSNIAKEYNVSKSTIYSIFNNKNWKFI